MVYQTSNQLLPEAAAQLRGPLVLRDASTVHVRAIRADDANRLRAFHQRLSADTVYKRFFAILPELPIEMAKRLASVDYENQMALLATIKVGGSERIIGVVRYARTGACSAELGFVVEDEWQGLGIGTALLHRLAEYARNRGFQTFSALTNYMNTRMMRLFRHSGFPCESRLACGELEVTLDISSPRAPDIRSTSRSEQQPA